MVDVQALAREAGFVEYELDDGTNAAFDRRYARLAALVAERCAHIAVQQHYAQSVLEAIRAAFPMPEERAT